MRFACWLSRRQKMWQEIPRNGEILAWSWRQWDTENIWMKALHAEWQQFYAGSAFACNTVALSIFLKQFSLVYLGSAFITQCFVHALCTIGCVKRKHGTCEGLLFQLFVARWKFEEIYCDNVYVEISAIFILLYIIMFKVSLIFYLIIKSYLNFVNVCFPLCSLHSVSICEIENHTTFS